MQGPTQKSRFTLQVAPITVKYIIKLFQLGCYNTNYFFRVDKGFVAQIADVVNGRLVPLSPMQKRATETTIPLEVTPDVIHVEGSLSIGRHADPNSGGSSFSILYSRQQHLDMQYTIFGYASSEHLASLVVTVCTLRFCALSLISTLPIDPEILQYTLRQHPVMCHAWNLTGLGIPPMIVFALVFCNQIGHTCYAVMQSKQARTLNGIQLAT